jgi:glycosyltransferase involved in cell wall biosynthesis
MIAAKIEVSAVALGSTPSRQGQDFPAARGRPLADRRINVIWTNAEQLPGFASVVGPEYFVGRYNVGFWAWESERLPAHLAANAAMLDEIWVPSRFVRDAVTPVVDRPVHIFPHPIVAPIPEPSFDPRSLGIPQGFTFLFTYDFLSSFERKNPLGVLAAFVEAFPDGGGPVLVLKSVNGAKRPAELERLLLAAGGRRDVVVIDEYLTAGERAALIASCGCFVSLHRAEGFGLGLGEAMALGKPVIATAYSGNLDFMSNDTAVLVPARLRTSRTTTGPSRISWRRASRCG